MNLFIDDIRNPPDNSWTIARTSIEAIEIIDANSGNLEIVSFDHDLGGDDTTRPVVLHMCEFDIKPQQIVIHSANPVGREWLSGMVERYLTF